MTLTVRADKGASTLQKPLLESSEGEIQGGSVNPITKLPDGPYPPIAEARARLNRNLRWYRCPLPAETLRDCMQRSDFEGWKQTLGHLGLWFSTLFFAWGVWRWNFYDNSALSGVFMSQTTAEGEIHPISQDDPLSKQEENAALTAETGPSGPSFLSLLLQLPPPDRPHLQPGAHQTPGFGHVPFHRLVQFPQVITRHCREHVVLDVPVHAPVEEFEQEERQRDRPRGLPEIGDVVAEAFCWVWD